jgi:hypothetical protein
MKKMITLLLCVGAVASTFAQTSADESRRIILGKQGTTERERQERSSKDVILGREDRKVNNETRTRYPIGSREQRIKEINREYDAKVQSIRNNRTLSAAEKERTIRQLNADRTSKIKAINGRYNDGRRYDDKKDRDHDRRDRDDDDRNYKAKKNKSNNGNHYGWEKGKGNPHKNGGKPGKKNK